MRVLLLLFSILIAFLSVTFKDKITSQFTALTNLLNQNNTHQVYLFLPLRLLNRTSKSADMTAARTIQKAFLAVEQAEGAGARVRRSIGTPKLRNFDPFLMLDHFNIPPGAGFPDHPHRGQETITYLLEGAVDHEDFTGSAGTIEAGDLQFMTAGKGIVHAEMPNQNQRANIGMQLWVDLAKKDKMCEPRYRDLKASEIPHVDVDDGKVKVKVISGKSHGIDSVQELAKTEVWLLDIDIKPGGKITQELPETFNSFAYTLAGSTQFGEGEDKTLIGQYHNVVFARDGKTVVAEVDESASENGRFSKSTLLFSFLSRRSLDVPSPTMYNWFGFGLAYSSDIFQKRNTTKSTKGKNICPPGRSLRSPVIEPGANAHCCILQ